MVDGTQADGVTQRLTDPEAYERARQMEYKAQGLRAEANSMLARASRYQRWAQRWRGWADDDYGDVPYPGETR